MYKPWTCRKCGAPMYGPNDHDTTAGCNVAWPSTITTGDTSGYVTSESTIWGSEEGRRLSRYDDAIRLLRECTEWAGRAQMPGIDWWDVQIDEGTMEEALAFLAAEPKEKP